MKSMLTDIKRTQLKSLRDFLFSKMFPNKDNAEQEKLSDWMELLRDVEYILDIAPQSYRQVPKADKNKYYLVKCECGWWGSSKLLLGGGQIADTGDYSDCFCPVCHNCTDL